jgi:D-glycero-D-manno-heptose 1,7-bisphosphate phosphatase
VFLDRDGTLVRDVPYLHEPDRVELLPGVVEGLRLLQSRGLRLVIVTNQQGIGLGYFTKQAFFTVNQRLLKALSGSGVSIAKIYYCPHSQSDSCSCRKPNTRLLENALMKYRASAEDCYLIGNSACDIRAGARLGVTTVAVGDPGAVAPVYRADGFADAANWIVARQAVSRRAVSRRVAAV